MVLRTLDPKIKIVWALPVATPVLLLFLAIIGAVFVFDSNSAFGIGRITLSLLIFAAFVIFFAVPYYYYLNIEYAAFTYELTDGGISISKRIFARRTDVIPYDQIQNIYAEKTIYAWILGIGTVHIETASTNPDTAEVLIPGIANTKALIEEISAKTAHAREAKAGGGVVAATDRQLLEQMLEELRQIRKSIEMKKR